MNVRRFSRNKVLSIIVVVAMMSGAAIAIGRWAGRVYFGDVRDRLELRWADLMTLPEDERAVLVRAAIACDLMQQSIPTAGSVEACVREGANKISATLPDSE